MGEAIQGGPEALIDRIHELKVIPEVALRLQKMARSDRATPKTLERLIRTDPVLSARILRLANSPLYGVSREVTSLSRAIHLLGFDVITDLALALAFTSQARSFGPHALATWEHCVRSACAARLLAVPQRGISQDHAFTTGLLTDVGRLLLYSIEPDRCEAIFVPGSPPRLADERAALGFDHAQLAATFLRHWGLPDSTCHVVERHHHMPAADCETWRLHATVHLAEHTAVCAWDGTGGLDLAALVKEHPLTLHLGLAPDEVVSATGQLAHITAWLLRAL